MEVIKIITIFFIFIALSSIYKSIKLDESNNNNAYYHAMIEKYLLNKNNLGSAHKPILWVFLHNSSTTIPEVNSRFWLNFESRATTNFNQPYQKLTIQSIINKCGDDFNICLIDDRAFKILLPEWKVDLSSTALPIQSHLRLIAIATLLNIYGGLIIPSSFICYKSLRPIYENIDITNKIVVGNFNNLTSNELLNTTTIASPIMMGCKAGCPTMYKFIEYLSKLNSNDFTAQMDFKGDINVYLENLINTNEALSISGCLLGVQKINGDLIYIEELVGNQFIDIDPNAYGLYIPWDQLINRISLQWFVRLSPEQVLKSNTMIGKYILANY